MDLKEKLECPHVKIGGIYQHYKSEQMTYQVLCLALNEETKETLVIYKALYGEQLVWARPLSSWLETISTIDGSQINRFTFIKD